MRVKIASVLTGSITRRRALVEIAVRVMKIVRRAVFRLPGLRQTLARGARAEVLADDRILFGADELHWDPQGKAVRIYAPKIVLSDLLIAP